MPGHPHPLCPCLSLQEEAVHRWVRALGAVQSLLADPYRPPPAPRSHLQLLHRQLIMGLLRRTDTLLFRKLLAGELRWWGGGGAVWIVLLLCVCVFVWRGA